MYEVRDEGMTAMTTLHDNAPQTSQMPRFVDGMVNIQELILTIAESAINEIMDA